MTRTMIIASGLPKTFWAEAVNAACYIIIRPLLEKTSSELLKGRKYNITHLRASVNKCFVYNNGKITLGKLNTKRNGSVLFGYSSHSKAYKVYNKRTLCV